MKKRLLLTGVSGFLGWNICKLYKQDWDIHGIYHNREIKIDGVHTYKGDITNYARLKELFLECKPDAVIHLAALSIPNYCEIHEEESYAINVEASAYIASLCAEASVPMLFTSTDLIFDGKNAPYDEESSCNNAVSVYGRHKGMAEILIRAVNPKVTICRMPLMFGEAGPVASSWLQDLLKQMKNGQELFLFDDEYRTVVSGSTAAKGLMLMLEKNYRGIIHLGGRECISRYHFGLLVKDIFNYPQAKIIATKQADVKMAAPRPADVSLDSSKAFVMGYNPLLVRDELQNCFRNLYIN